MILTILVIATPLFFLFVVESIARGHDLATDKRATKAITEIIKKYKPNAKNFYDLGCAHGILALRLRKIFPNVEIYGIDNGGVRIFFAKLRELLLRRKVKFQKQDVFSYNLQDADVVYAFWRPNLLSILEKKLLQELMPGSIVITKWFQFANWKPIVKIELDSMEKKYADFETLFVYVK